MICKYCSTKTTRYDTTNHRSANKADVKISASLEMLSIYGNRAKYEIPAKFCPVCGRDLSKPPVRYSEHDYSNIIRENIKREMKRDGLSYDALSRITGIAKTTIYDFLHGKVNNLSAGKVALVSDALRLPIEKLFLPYGVEETYEEASDNFR